MAVDLETGATVLEEDLEFAPVEMAVVTGEPESMTPGQGAGHEGESHEGHEGHEGHDH